MILTREGAKGWLEIIAIIIAGIWVVSTFFWAEWFVPRYITPPQISVEVEVSDIGKKSGPLLPLKIKQKIINKSKVDVGIFGTWYHVYGIETHPLLASSRTPEECANNIGNTSLNKYNRLANCSSFLEKRPKIKFLDSCGKERERTGKITDVGKLNDHSQGFRILPGEEIVREFITHVPSNFNLVRVELEVRFGRLNDMVVLDWKSLPDGSLTEVVVLKGEKNHQAFDPCKDREKYLALLREHSLAKSFAVVEYLID